MDLIPIISLRSDRLIFALPMVFMASFVASGCSRVEAGRSSTAELITNPQALDRVIFETEVDDGHLRYYIGAPIARDELPSSLQYNLAGEDAGLLNGDNYRRQFRPVRAVLKTHHNRVITLWHRVRTESFYDSDAVTVAEPQSLILDADLAEGELVTVFSTAAGLGVQRYRPFGSNSAIYKDRERLGLKIGDDLPVKPKGPQSSALLPASRWHSPSVLGGSGGPLKNYSAELAHQGGRWWITVTAHAVGGDLVSHWAEVEGAEGLSFEWIGGD